MSLDMQAKPLVISISAEAGRDDLNGLVTVIVHHVEDRNEHLKFHRCESKSNGPHLRDTTIWFRPEAK